MTAARCCAVLIALAACNRATEGSEPADESAPRTDEAARPGATEAPAAGPSRDEVHAFCVEAFETAAGCVGDDAFWNVMSTMYVARYFPDDQVAPEARAMWIDKMRDYLAGVRRDDAVAANCDATLANTRWPTRAHIERVRKAAVSCTDFANAYGHMIFGDGVFHDPR